MADTSARQVADYMIAFLAEHGDLVTNLKLQKLLYYAQGWYLAFYDTPLFSERMEAWIHGPVVPSVYGDFKVFSWQPIPRPDGDRALPERPSLLINEVMEVYGGMGAYDLERLTHRESPWLEARAGMPMDEASHALITHASLRAFFRSQMSAEREA